jgi:hypothetical protein
VIGDLGLVIWDWGAGRGQNIGIADNADLSDEAFSVVSSHRKSLAKSEGVKDLPAFATRKRCGRDLAQEPVGFWSRFCNAATERREALAGCTPGLLGPGNAP